MAESRQYRLSKASRDIRAKIAVVIRLHERNVVTAEHALGCITKLMRSLEYVSFSLSMLHFRP